MIVSIYCSFLTRRDSNVLGHYIIGLILSALFGLVFMAALVRIIKREPTYTEASAGLFCWLAGFILYEDSFGLFFYLLPAVTTLLLAVAASLFVGRIFYMLGILEMLDL